MLKHGQGGGVDFAMKFLIFRVPLAMSNYDINIACQQVNTEIMFEGAFNNKFYNTRALVQTEDLWVIEISFDMIYL